MLILLVWMMLLAGRMPKNSVKYPDKVSVFFTASKLLIYKVIAGLGVLEVSAFFTLLEDANILMEYKVLISIEFLELA